MKRALLALVLLSPWLVAVWVGLHNLRQPRRLQLLTGTTAALPIGGWLLLSSSLGATLGATGVAALLRTERPARRSRSSPAAPEENLQEEEFDGGVAGESEPEPGYWRDAESSSLGEPPPIMDVPFRVVRAARSTDPDASAPPAYSDDDWQPPEAEAW